MIENYTKMDDYEVETVSTKVYTKPHRVSAINLRRNLVEVYPKKIRSFTIDEFISFLSDKNDINLQKSSPKAYTLTRHAAYCGSVYTRVYMGTRQNYYPAGEKWSKYDVFKDDRGTLYIKHELAISPFFSECVFIDIIKYSALLSKSSRPTHTMIKEGFY